MDTRFSESRNMPPKKKRRVNECTHGNATAPLMRDDLVELPVVKVKEKCFQLVPASPSLCELGESFFDSFHSPAEKQKQQRTQNTLTPGTEDKLIPSTHSTPPAHASPTGSTPSTVKKSVTPPTFSTPPTLKPLLKFPAVPKAVGASLPPPRRLKSSTVKRSLDFSSADRKLDEEWLERIMESRPSQRDMNCPAYKQPSLILSSMLGSNTVILPDHPNDPTTSERQRPNVQYLSILGHLPREQ